MRFRALECAAEAIAVLQAERDRATLRQRFFAAAFRDEEATIARCDHRIEAIRGEARSIELGVAA